MKLSDKLKTIRREKGLTQEAMSDLLNVSRSTYTHYERGSREPDLETLARIANILEVSTDYLISDVASRRSADKLIDYLVDIRNKHPELKISDINFDKLSNIDLEHINIDLEHIKE